MIKNRLCKLQSPMITRKLCIKNLTLVNKLFFNLLLSHPALRKNSTNLIVAVVIVTLLCIQFPVELFGPFQTSCDFSELPNVTMPIGSF